jgi:very-short-patch-repair endonuclease
MNEFDCVLCGRKHENCLALIRHLKKHKDVISTLDYLKKYVKLQCLFCNKDLDFGNKFNHGQFCNVFHFTSYKNQQKGIELPEKCHICDSAFENKRYLGKHLTIVHKVDIKEYYDKYYKKSDQEGKCKWCSKEVKFSSLTRGYTDFCYNTSCNVLWYNKYKNRSVNAGKNIKISHSTGDKIPTQLGYWLKKGHSLEEATELLNDRQTTFTKEKCIERHGEEKGLEKWKERQDRWLSNFERLGGFSKVSQELFWEIYNNLNNKYSDIFFATNDNGIRNDKKNKEYRIKTQNTTRLLDFYIPSINKCIEFDGSYWHGEKRGNQKRDSEREYEILETYSDMKILHIKEQDYKKDKYNVINSCLEFLNE